MTLRDWTQLHCSELDIGTNRDLVLPIPFATVLPGIMLAGEIVKERYYPDAVLRDVVNHDTASLPGNWLTTLYGPKSGCSVCGDSMVFEDPIETEGFIGALLRDIEDAGQDDHDDDADPDAASFDGIFDLLCLGPNEIFYVTDIYAPISILEFISGFLAEYPQLQPAHAQLGH